MLQSLRDLSKSWLFKGLMAFLVISFAIWGVGDMFRTNPSQRVVATVGDVEIPVHVLEARFQIEMPGLRRSLGSDFTISQARQLGFLDRTLAFLIEEASLHQNAQQLGLSFDDVYVMKKLAESIDLMDENGRFRQDVWQKMLQDSGMSESFFIDQKKKEMERRIVLGSLTEGLFLPDSLVDDLYRAMGAKRVFEVLTIDDQSQSLAKAPTEDELTAYYQQHEEDFAAPEYRGVTVAQLIAKDLAKDIAVTDEDVQKAYVARADELNVPERRELVQIIFQDEDKAKAFYASAKSANSFMMAAKAKGLTAVPLGKMDERGILPELYTSVFSIDEGSFTEPVKTDLGWHVVLVKKIYPGGKPSLADIRDELRERLKEERIGDNLAKTVNQLDDLLAAGNTLEDIADTLRLRLLRFPATDAAGLSADGRAIKDMPHKDMVIQEAFGLQTGETSQVMEDGEGNYFVVRTDQIEPSRIKPLKEVKEDVLAAWEKEQKTASAEALAQKITEKLRQGEKTSAFASLRGVDIRLSRPLSVLGDTDPLVPAVLAPSLLRMKKGDAMSSAIDGRHYVLKLVDILPVDPKKAGPVRTQVAKKLAEDIENNYVQTYAQTLIKAFPREIDAQLMESLKN